MRRLRAAAGPAGVQAEGLQSSGAASVGADHGGGTAREGGFLLLEALIALAIIGTVAIALLAATGSQVRSADKAAVLLVASALAQDRLAAVQLLDHEGMAGPPDSLLAGAFPAPFDEFVWTVEVVEAEEEYDLFAVRIEVSGRGEAYPLETLIHRPPLTVTPGAAGLPPPAVSIDGTFVVPGGRGGRGGGGEGRGAGGGGRAGGPQGRGGLPPGAGPPGRGGRGGGGRGVLFPGAGPGRVGGGGAGVGPLLSPSVAPAGGPHVPVGGATGSPGAGPAGPAAAGGRR